MVVGEATDLLASGGPTRILRNGLNFGNRGELRAFATVSQSSILAQRGTLSIHLHKFGDLEWFLAGHEGSDRKTVSGVVRNVCPA